MSSKTVDWEAIARYLAGESPDGEKAAVQRWLASNPAEAKFVATLDDALARPTLAPGAESDVDVEAALALVKSRRDEGLRVVRGAAPRIDRFGAAQANGFRWIPIAAAAAVVIAAGALIWRGQARDQEDVPTIIAARTLSSPVGGRDTLVLPDGSQVILGPGSALTIAEGFGQTARRVSLDGDALFTVVHDEGKPFVVVANDTEIRDVGTAFVVHCDAGGVRVAVTEGVVELSPRAPVTERTTLNAGDVARVSRAGQVVTERGVGTDDDLAWTRGRLVFRDTPLGEVSEALRRWYGVHLDIRDPALRRRPLSATFEGDSIGKVLDTIGLAIGASMELRGDVAVVRSLPR
jgi:transmembrane sensor